MPYCKESLKAIMELSLQCYPEIGWENIVNCAQNHWKSEVLKSCNVYQIWKHRNAVLHMDSISSEEQIVAAIRKQVMRTKRFAMLYCVCWLACPACFNRILLDYCHVMETAGCIED